MSRIVLAALVLSLLAFAPSPSRKVNTDPEKALEQYMKDLKAHARAGAALQAKKKKVIELFRKREAALRKQGKTAEADAFGDRATLLAAVDADRPLDRTTLAELLKRASVGGKYRKLLRVLYLPGDQASYGAFTDFGFWNGNAYGDQTDLPPGNWVYVHPRWFIWDGPAAGQGQK
jgi:hypothetical protein